MIDARIVVTASAQMIGDTNASWTDDGHLLSLCDILE